MRIKCGLEHLHSEVEDGTQTKQNVKRRQSRTLSTELMMHHSYYPEKKCLRLININSHFLKSSSFVKVIGFIICLFYFILVEESAKGGDAKGEGKKKAPKVETNVVSRIPGAREAKLKQAKIVSIIIEYVTLSY